MYPRPERVKYNIIKLVFDFNTTYMSYCQGRMANFRQIPFLLPIAWGGGANLAMPTQKLVQSVGLP